MLAAAQYIDGVSGTVAGLGWGAARRTVLVVDSDLATIRTVRTALSTHGFEVHATSEAERAVPMAGARQPRVIIVDPTMQGRGGADIVPRLKANPRTAGIPIIVATAGVRPADTPVGATIAADHYLSKPLTADDLLDAVQATLGGRRRPTVRPARPGLTLAR